MKKSVLLFAFILVLLMAVSFTGPYPNSLALKERGN